jgi:RsiW-degrading membrane proteinase PrsW (M82 family)
VPQLYIPRRVWIAAAMIQLAGFAVSVLVPLLVLVLIHQGRHCPWPRARLRSTVYFASITAFVTAIASAMLVLSTSAGDGSFGGRVAATWRILPLLAFLEELSRFVVLVGYSLRGPASASRRDGIMYGFAAGIAFALLENVMTFGGPGAGSAASGWLRVGLATPLHSLLGGLMGYLLVRARSGGLMWIAVALRLPTAIHIVYDAPVLFAVSRAGEKMTLETAAAAVGVSAAIVLALAATMVWLFRRAAPAVSPAPSRTPPAG